MPYRFGRSSEKHLSTCHKDLQLIARTAIQRSKVDFGIHCGHRSVEDQQKAFRAGHSQIDGVNKKGKHNYYPSLAFDFHVYVTGKPNLTWDEVHVVYVGTVIQMVADELYRDRKITHQVRWGGNWDGDGQIKYDQSLWDPVHIELVK